MSKKKKIIWTVIIIVTLTALLNTIIIAIATIYDPNVFWILIITIPLSAVGIYDVHQTIHLLDRYLTVDMRESGKHTNLEWLTDSIYPRAIKENDFKVPIGNDQCTQPYNSSMINIVSTKVFNLEKLKMQTPKEKKPDYFKNSMDEELSVYNLSGDDLVWQIGPDYIGCRTENGNFNSKIFKRNACRPEVKMIEVKLTSAIEYMHPIDPSLNIGYGAIPKTCNKRFPNSPYSTFSEVEGMIHFLDCLRELSGGKPTGIRTCISDKKEFYEICYAIRKSQVIPDFIVVEDLFQVASIANSDQAFKNGMPLYEALLFVSQTLQVHSLEKDIKLIAAGKFISGFDILKVLALGAKVVFTEMTGRANIKYHIKGQKASSFDKKQNVYDCHNSLMSATIRTMKACGIMSVSDITLSKFLRTLDVFHPKGFEKQDGPVSYPGIAKKAYTSKIKSYQLREERKGLQYRSL